MNIETRYTDNISDSYNQKNINTIHSDNIFNKVSVTAVDNDEILAGLSPFIKTGVKNIKNDSVILNKHNISKYFTDEKLKNKKIKNFVNFLILSKIAKNYPKILENPAITSILNNNSNKSFFDSHIKGIYSLQLITVPRHNKSLNLHNIYYKYISNCYKNSLKRYKIHDVDFNIKIDDARNVIKNDNSLYNLIFLDAFTPQKCPCLWSYDFFKELYRVLDLDGMLLTYSSSALVRSAMLAAGFFIGYIFNGRLNKFQGTVAVKNKALIKYTLSQADLGLLKTRAGIFYRDKNLNAQNEAIIMARNLEVEKSDRISSSKYLKTRSNNEI